MTATLLPSVISHLCSDLTRVGLDIHDEPRENVAEKILNGTVDLGILALGLSIPNELSVEVVAQDRLVAIASAGHRPLSRTCYR